MHKAARNLLIVIGLVIVQACISSVSAQGISATFSSTNSICYNDGTITVTASGGTGPYTYEITTGPSNPNVTYPITLLPGDNTFGGLPSGTFTVVVTDANGNTGTFTTSVGGSYQFPSMTFSTAISGSIIGTVSGGLAPYQYTISTTGSNSGFGPYQVSDTFSHLCPGTYWIRVRDSCGNIYTDEVIFADTITSTIQCVNFSKGTLNVTATGGTPPYTYTFGAASNTTGSFTGLTPYFADSLVITDACGTRFTEYISPPFFSLMELCPFNGEVFCPNISYPISPDVFTFDCLNCSPPQSVTVSYNGGTDIDTLFHNQPAGVNFDIVITSSACGGDTIQHAPVAITTDIEINANYISCRSVQVTVAANGTPIPVDSFVLSYVRYGQTIEENTTGFFYHLPDSTYIVTAYINGLCNDTPFVPITIPYFGNGCFVLMKDASCQNVWEYSTNSLVPELYSLVIAPLDTVASSPGGSYNANFYDLAPGTTYTLVSDSGCAEPLPAPPPISPVPTVIAYLPCVGQPVVQFTPPNYTYCNGSTVASTSEIRIQLSYQDSLIFDQGVFTDASTFVNITDSGWYHYAIYAINTADSSPMLRYDSICPIDTGSVYMNNTQIPYLNSSVALVCDTISQSVATYQIYGGSAPYTVQIPGYDTITLQGNTGVFPTQTPGTYTMLVYDNCGISRSVTFVIVDTCSGCPYGAIYLLDTFSCAGDTIPLICQSIQAISYQWFVNGQLYSTAKDTSFVSAAGGNTIMLIVTSATGCADTAIKVTADTCNGCPYVAINQPDTLYCVGSTVHLTNASIGGVSYQWLINGQPYSIAADTIFIPESSGYDTIELLTTSATACTRSASILIDVVSPDTIDLGPDTTYCGGFTRVLSSGFANAIWSTGATGAQITVTTPGTYQAQVTNICGTATASITLSEKPIPTVDLGNDTLVCLGSVITLNAGNAGGNYLWQDGTTAQTYVVTSTGTYAVSVTVNGCTGADSLTITFISAPAPFSLGKDTTICAEAPLTLDAYQPYTYFLWNTGSTSPLLTVDQTGKYEVTDSNECGKTSDSINITVDDCICRVNIPTAFSPNKDGKNDTYGGVAWCIPKNYLLEIFDRWGQKLFTSTSIFSRWDGTYNNREQPIGVYVYYMKYTDPYSNIEYTQSGNVTLIR